MLLSIFIYIHIYVFVIVLHFFKNPELPEILRRERRLIRCGGELSLSLGPKCLGPLLVAEGRTQVQSSGSRQTGPPGKRPRDQELLGGFCCHSEILNGIL